MIAALAFNTPMIINGEGASSFSKLKESIHLRL